MDDANFTMLVAVVVWIVSVAGAYGLVHVSDSDRIPGYPGTGKQVRNACIAAANKDNMRLFVSTPDAWGFFIVSGLVLTFPAFLIGMGIAFGGSSLAFFWIGVALLFVLIPLLIRQEISQRYSFIIASRKMMYVCTLSKGVRIFPTELVQGYVTKNVGSVRFTRFIRKIYITHGNDIEELALPLSDNDDELYALLHSLGAKNLTP